MDIAIGTVITFIIVYMCIEVKLETGAYTATMFFLIILILDVILGSVQTHPTNSFIFNLIEHLSK